jgi:esterase/lipase
MKIEAHRIIHGEVDIPTITMISSESSPNVVVIHGYGGNKEEQLGLSWRIATLGFNTFTIDLRGHGENTLPLSLKIRADVDTLVNNISRDSRPTVVVGHSSGGRLALLSKAKWRIGISPALSKSYSEETKTFIKRMRQYRVIEEDADINFEIADQLPLVESQLTEQDLIVYGSRDVPEIIQYCESLSKLTTNVVKVENALHNDIFNLEETFSAIKNHLQKLAQLHFD